jgi:hypothetical protein
VPIRGSVKAPTTIYYCKILKLTSPGHFFKCLIINLSRTDYVTWNGPDPDIRKGPSQTAAKGPNVDVKKSSPVRSNAKGANPENRKGPSGTTTGSLHLQNKAAAAAARAAEISSRSR